jgi:hypothetical protein
MTSPSTSGAAPAQEQSLLERARTGDESAFGRLVEPYRGELHAHAWPGEPLVESVWIEPYADNALGLKDGLAAPDASCERRESVELALPLAVVNSDPSNERQLV